MKPQKQLFINCCLALFLIILSYAFSDFFYKQVILPRLPQWRQVPLLYWTIMFFPYVFSICIMSSLTTSFSQALLYAIVMRIPLELFIIGKAYITGGPLMHDYSFDDIDWIYFAAIFFLILTYTVFIYGISWLYRLFMRRVRKRSPFVPEFKQP